MYRESTGAIRFTLSKHLVDNGLCRNNRTFNISIRNRNIEKSINMQYNNTETQNCVFCKVINKVDDNSEILQEDTKFTLIKDIRPAAAHHYLVLTKQHIKNPKCLTSDDITLGGDLNDTLLGFHWPPFNSINHLHLHVISPKSEMSFFQRIIFRPSFYFTTVESLIEWLSQKN
ncbi:histidine triad nucleotide-binding protein 3-like protein [Leptotrombidium deliense]|uniref:Histidine triad nucleotide-binding protein 3-like protein n=1 Tax=Leptotrombidium deliense TaxID=299467 RepID=A0A443SUC8_9ACAR|nr:histidine triad nucleotide-binding protein 3-like protein [Leptotrombidium deliense]